jgi:hypothetical protein
MFISPRRNYYSLLSQQCRILKIDINRIKIKKNEQTKWPEFLNKCIKIIIIEQNNFTSSITVVKQCFVEPSLSVVIYRKGSLFRHELLKI